MPIGNIKQRAYSGAPITADNATKQEYDALYIGAGGTVEVVLSGDLVDDRIQFVGVPAGTFMPIAIKYLCSNTSATSIIGLRVGA